MHPVNQVLFPFGIQLSKVNGNGKPTPRDAKEIEFRKQYDLDFEYIKHNHRGFEVHKTYRYQIGEHPKTSQEFEGEFVASHLYREKPRTILDIGSYRQFIIGLLAHYDVTTVDIRDRKALLANETVVNCDAKSLKFPDDAFDAVTSVGTLQTIGLGRYGDEVDVDADIKAFHEMVRALKGGGILIFTTTITLANPSIAWNARRNYSYEMIREFCQGLELVEEKFFDRQGLRLCALEDLTTDPVRFDFYLGCWRKA